MAYFSKMTFFVLTLGALGLVSFAGCTKNDSGAKEALGSLRKPSVVTTTGMIADAAKNIGGDLFTVTALMGAGVDPHLYKASAGDVDRLSQADLILYSGLHLEGKMSEVLEKLGARKLTIAVAENIPPEYLLGFGGKGTHDPHVWFDITLWQYAVTAVRDGLIQIAPDHKAEILENYRVYRDKLTALDGQIKEKSASLPQEKKIMITAHDAFEYFGKAYGFDVRGLQGISTVSEAGTKDVQDLATFIADHRVPAIFVETSVPRRNVEALQAAVKAKGYDVQIGGMLFSDAMGDAGSFEGTYIGMLTHNIDIIIQALNK